MTGRLNRLIGATARNESALSGRARLKVTSAERDWALSSAGAARPRQVQRAQGARMDSILARA
jgi:hypothetical protein